MKLTKYKWSYDRTNSKGKDIFRHDTGETIEDVINFLKKHGINYDKKVGASMIWIYSHHQKYSYYYTTGRWSPFIEGSYPKKHYHSLCIEDFYNRFLLPTIKEERLKNIGVISETN